MFSKILFLILTLFLSQSWAYPVIDRAVPTGGLPIKIYQDSHNENLYWYIPHSIEPWARNDKFKSQLSYKKGERLTFIFRGQASVDESMLKQVAKHIGTDVANLAPIAYDSSENLTCQNIYAGLNLQWLFPTQIGNYLEVVPVSIRTTESSLVDEVYELVSGGGLACTVNVTFKAVASGYHIKMTADMNEIYSRFEAGAHAEGLWWEVDLHTVIQDLYQKGVIKFEKYEDPEFAQTPLDKQIQSSWEDVTKRVIELMFKAAPKLPDGGMAGRGRPFSLRVDYQKSTTNKNFTVELHSKFVSKKTSQIGLRLALE